MRSGLENKLKASGSALHLTDHDIFYRDVTFSYNDPSIREKVGSMKLQSYIKINSGDHANDFALINFAVDSSSFLPREFLPPHHFTNVNLPKLIAAIILPTKLNVDNSISLDPNGEPILKAGRERPFSNHDLDIQEIRELTKKAIIAVKDVLNIELLLPLDKGEYNWSDETFFKALPLGGVAHELGTLPLHCHDSDDDPALAIVKPNLELQVDSRQGVYVCDLSVFPFSPEVNPTPTLVALALRLSRETLLSRTPDLGELRGDTIYVVNQSGEDIKVYVSNITGANLTPEENEDNETGGRKLKAREHICRRRFVIQPKNTMAESVLVYSLKPGSAEYFPQPATYLATPGVICVIEI